MLTASGDVETMFLICNINNNSVLSWLLLILLIINYYSTYLQLSTY